LAISLINVSPYPLLLAFLISSINIVIRAGRWKTLLITIECNTEIKTLIKIVILGLTFNNLIPGKIFGEPVRVYLLNKVERKNVGKIFPTIVIEKVLEILFLIMLFTISVFFLYIPLTLNIIYFGFLSSIFLLISIFFIFYIAFNKKLVNKYINKMVLWSPSISKSIIQKSSTILLQARDALHIGFRQQLSQFKNLTFAILLTFVHVVLDVLRLKILISAVGVDISIVSIILVFSASTLIAFIAVLPVGIGLLASTMFLLTFYGVPQTMSAVVAFLDRTTTSWFFMLLGSAILIINKRDLTVRR
jgi:hypothetical protein